MTRLNAGRPPKIREANVAIRQVLRFMESERDLGRTGITPASVGRGLDISRLEADLAMRWAVSNGLLFRRRDGRYYNALPKEAVKEVEHRLEQVSHG